MPTTISTGVTTTSTMSSTVVSLFDNNFALAYDKARIWMQDAFINWFPDLAEANGGSNIKFDVFNNVAPATTALTETQDPDPVSMALGTVTITPNEYGNAIMVTRKLQAMSYDDHVRAAARITANNQAQTLDYLVRAAILAAPYVFRVNNNSARTGLDATNDKVTFAYFTNLLAIAAGWGMEPVEGENWGTIVHPMVMPDIAADATWLAASEYAKPDNIWNGEAGQLGGVRFIAHRYGKLYLGGGTTAQTATTVATANTAAGDTAIAVTSGTGLSNGDYITIGTLEAADAEQVQIVSGGGTASLVVRGKGNVEGNQGMRFAHAIGDAVTEAANVAAIPLIGKGSLYGVASSVYGGRMGTQGIKSKDTNLPDRFRNTYWEWFGGFAVRQSQVIVGEAAVSGGVMEATLQY